MNSTKDIEKRALTKVRRKFLQKKEEEDQLIHPSTLRLSDNNVYILCSSTGLVEINRRIYSGPQYLNHYFNVTKSFIQDHSSSKAVTLALSSSQGSQAVPWEYSMKRLESFGDLELATWAHRIIKYRKNYTKFIEDLIKLHYCEDIQEIKNRQETIEKISQEIENTCSYYKVVNFHGIDSNIVKEISYSEGFLEQMGHSIESFLKWTNNSGLPPVFDHECSVYLQILKSLFEGSMLSLGTVNRGGEFKTFLVDNKGSKKEVVVESICLIEPVQRGILVRGYFILKDNNPICPQIAHEESKGTCLKQKKIEINSERPDMEKLAEDEIDQ